MVGMDMEVRTIHLRGGPHDGATRIVPATTGALYLAWAVGRRRCGKPQWGPVTQYTQDPNNPDQYHYQEQ